MFPTFLLAQQDVQLAQEVQDGQVETWERDKATWQTSPRAYE